MRELLPFREKTELFLINENGKLVVEDHDTYLMFPGGGIDKNEDLIISAIRELQEETNYKVLGNLVPIVTVSWDWFPEWANNEKRKERYQKFRGERVHMFIGKAGELEKSDGKCEDEWKCKDGMDPNKCIEKFISYAKKDNKNVYPYRIAQIMAIKASCILNGIFINDKTIDLL